MDNVKYFIKRPTSGRKTFDVVAYVRGPHKQKQYIKLTDALKTQVQSINQQFLSQTVTEREALTLLQDLIQVQYRKFKVRDMVIKNSRLSEINQKVFNNFWSKVYETKELVDEDSARYDFQKAIRLIEPVSLASGSAADFKKRLKSNTGSASEHRRAVDRLNQIFKFLNRDIRLNKPEEGVREIRYLREPELQDLLAHIKDSVEKDLVVTLFCSGLRIGEAMALKPSDLRDGQLFIEKQITRKGQLKKPKRGKAGNVVLIPFGIEAVERWCNVADKEPYRQSINETLARASRAAFSDKSKWISPHDLRHSHAIYLLGRGAQLDKVALNLRNRIEVCQKYYTGFAHTVDTVDILKKILK